MKELLKLLIEETQAEGRSCWYESGYDVRREALDALERVLQNALHRLDNPEEK